MAPWANAGWLSDQGGWYKNKIVGGATAFTWNPADAASGITLANSNRDLTGETAGGFSSVRTTAGKTTGLWYCEFTIVSLGFTQPNLGLGLANAAFAVGAGAYLGSADKSVMYLWANQNSFSSTAFTVANAIPATQNLTAGDVIQIAADFTSGKAWLGQNNTWKTGSPSAGTSPWLTFTPGSDTWFFAGTQNAAAGSGTSSDAQLAATATFTPPTGFSAINA
jgi:hypothetical protein